MVTGKATLVVNVKLDLAAMEPRSFPNSRLTFGNSRVIFGSAVLLSMLEKHEPDYGKKILCLIEH